MTTSTPAPTEAGLELKTRLNAYLEDVAAALGIRRDACTVDLAGPVTARMRLNWRLPGFPERDVDLMWHEEHGWSAAVATHSGDDHHVVVAYLGGRTVASQPRLVARFTESLRTGEHQDCWPGAPTLRTACGPSALAKELSAWA
ncbi:hypothetical protein SAMN04489729_1866 [Amycolatopsis lurida]|uniref:DUF6292 domain-containing protein n=1 Tax=Amycolatopsis lurida NRRL 2430 TaxID=1460371 RepID=A0A2P2FH02_AMYLU|nr:DUF6292 family protein [Amycolatopsis lurida]KFU76010.1 hypothetical protein BB31_38520 [Amycolatopsis lurida NRRL 2430]SEC55941.1 hypothetical protein SAMN04489729_1866 [Amycolatopsis lurida]